MKVKRNITRTIIMNISIAYLNQDFVNTEEHYRNRSCTLLIMQNMRTIVVNVKYTLVRK